MKEFVSNGEKNTEEIAFEFAKKLHGGDVVAFIGDMGMGKTVFVRGAMKYLNPEAEISSPTFSIVNDYSGNINIYHFDMYRVETWDSLYSTGFFEYLNENSILFIEWSENIENVLPANTVTVEFSRGDSEKKRIIKIDGGDGRW